MARSRSQAPPSQPPSINKSEGRRRLATLVSRGEALWQQRPLKEGQEDVWSTSCIETIQAIFGEDSGHIYTFVGPQQVIVSRGGGGHVYDRDKEARDAALIMRRIGVMRTLIEQIDLEIGFEEPPRSQTSFWNDIHPSITRVAQARYEATHFADCVEAAFKEINSLVKEHVRRRTGTELDGASLMNKAFSPNNPLILLDDLSTESGRGSQQGYMQIYAGAMSGIRNPKAHANIVINDARARHFLYLASLLAYRFDERL